MGGAFSLWFCAGGSPFQDPWGPQGVPLGQGLQKQGYLTIFPSLEAGLAPQA